MRITIIFCLFLVLPFSVAGHTAPIDSLLKVLDSTIKEKPFFEKRKQHKIDSLKSHLLDQLTLKERYKVYNDIFEEYSRYNLDSALQIAYKKQELSKQMGDDLSVSMANMNVSEILGRMGMYKESLDILNAINTSTLDQVGKTYYYHLYHSLYSLLEENSLVEKQKTDYKNIILAYKDSLITTLPPTDLTRATMRKGKLLAVGRYDEALRILDSCFVHHQHSERRAGILNYEISDIYEKIGDGESQKKYLIIASIYDLRRAVKSYIALRKLAALLYQEGDIERANTYVQCAMEDAISSKARFRTLEISETLPIITAAYDKKEQQDKERLVSFLVLISILSAILCIGVVYIWQQYKKLAHARLSLDEMYVEVKKMNGELNNFNLQLTESNLVKEEYIGTVFNLCSTYIAKIEAYRININRKLKAGQIEDALKTTSSTNLASTEIKEFLQLFDAVFMNLYPTFIDDFNEMLQEEERLYPRNEDILPPELRVFALMKLGITDSSKIATFLHYSPQTIYNYKLRIKNKLAISKEEFSQIMHIDW